MITVPNELAQLLQTLVKHRNAFYMYISGTFLQHATDVKNQR
jgi:hypothetical protein